MKKIRKILSLFITAVLASTSICVFSFILSAEGNEVSLRNPGFEEGSDTEASSWGLWPGWNVGNFICTDTVHSGNRSVKVELSQQQNYALYAGGYRMTDFELGSAMTLKMWVKYENVTGGFFFGLERKNNDTAVANAFSEAYTGSSDGWIQLIYNVPATEEVLSENIIKVEINKGTGILYIDDITLEYSNSATAYEDVYVRNASFERGDTADVSDWGLYPGWTSDNITADAHTGIRAVKVTLSEENNYALFSGGYRSENFDISAAFTVSAWVKYESLEGGFKIVTERKTDDGVRIQESKTYTGNSDGWKQISFTVGAMNMQFNELIIKFDILNGSGTVYFDDISLTMCENRNILVNGGFEKGDTGNRWGCFNADTFVTSNAEYVYEGEKALLINQDAQKVFAFWSDTYGSDYIDASKALELSVWVKYEGLTGNGFSLIAENASYADIRFTASLSGSSHGWQHIVWRIPADEGRTNIRFKAEVSAGEGKIAFDNAEIYMSNRQSVVAGDADGNGATNLLDMIRLMKYLAGNIGEIDFVAVDTNFDNLLDRSDLVALRNTLIGIA